MEWALEHIVVALYPTDRRTQEVVVLLSFHEMTPEQAAEILGISRRTVWLGPAVVRSYWPPKNNLP